MYPGITTSCFIFFLPFDLLGESNNSDFVRQGLRAVVSGRTQSGIRTPQSPLSGLGAQGPGVVGPGGGNSPMNPAAGQSPQQQPTSQQTTPQQQMNMTNPNDIESMRFNFDNIAQPGK